MPAASFRGRSYVHLLGTPQTVSVMTPVETTYKTGAHASDHFTEANDTGAHRKSPWIEGELFSGMILGFSRPQGYYPSVLGPLTPHL